MIRVRRVSRLSRAAALLVASLQVAGVGLGAAEQDAPLADAVQRGDRATMLSLLEQQVDVNAAQGDGATALHWAVYVNDADTTALLIRAGANVNAPNHYGVTPLGLGVQERQCGDHRAVGDGRRRSERSGAGGERRRDAAHARGALRTGRCGDGAAERRRRRQRAGNLERTIGAHVGGGRRARPRRGDAARSRRRHPRALRQRCDAALVCRAQGQHERRPRLARGRVRRETRRDRMARPRCWWRSSTGTKISWTCCSNTAPTRTSRAGRRG